MADQHLGDPALLVNVLVETCTGCGHTRDVHTRSTTGDGRGDACACLGCSCVRFVEVDYTSPGLKPLDLHERTLLGIVLVAEQARQQAEHVLAKYGLLASPHEAHSVLLEEIAELFDEVRKQGRMRSRGQMRRECVDIAAVAIRYAAQLEAAGKVYDAEAHPPRSRGGVPS